MDSEYLTAQLHIKVQGCTYLCIRSCYRTSISINFYYASAYVVHTTEYSYVCSYVLGLLIQNI